MTLELRKARDFFYKERYYYLVAKKAPKQPLHKRGEAPKSLLREVM